MKLYGNLELASLIERVSAEDDAAYVHAMKKLNPSKNWETFKFKNGEACYVGNSPFSNTHGYGTDTALHGLSQLKEVEKFFKSKRCSPVLSVAGVVDPIIFKMLFEQKYGTLGCRNIYIYEESIHVVASENDNEIRIKEVSSKD